MSLSNSKVRNPSIAKNTFEYQGNIVCWKIVTIVSEFWIMVTQKKFIWPSVNFYWPNSTVVNSTRMKAKEFFSDKIHMSVVCSSLRFWWKCVGFKLNPRMNLRVWILKWSKIFVKETPSVFGNALASKI